MKILTVIDGLEFLVADTERSWNSSLLLSCGQSAGSASALVYAPAQAPRHSPRACYERCRPVRSYAPHCESESDAAGRHEAYACGRAPGRGQTRPGYDVVSFGVAFRSYHSSLLIFQPCGLIDGDCASHSNVCISLARRLTLKGTKSSKN